MPTLIAKKHIEMCLNPSKTSRTITFVIELRQLDSHCRDYTDLSTLANTYELSVCGSTRKNGCICQMQDEIISYRDRVRKEDLEKFDKIIKLWKKYHLNTLHAGTKAQEDAIAKAHISGGYTDHCKYLESINLLVDRGYKYGTDWLCQQLPDDVINTIKDL